MGTKNNPSLHDCYANAEPDEPLFILLARAPESPALVRLWRAVVAGDEEAAKTCVEYAIFLRRSAGRANLPYTSGKSQEAQKLSCDMLNWLRVKNESIAAEEQNRPTPPAVPACPTPGEGGETGTPGG